MSGTSALRGRDQESFLAVDLTGSTGRPLTMVEAQAKVLRFTGTLAAGVTLRLPLSATENPGYSGTFENQTTGGFSLVIAPAVGNGITVPPGTSATAFYDGTALVGVSPAGIAGTAGGVSTLYPLVILNPIIGDAITYSGDGTFVNTPSGAATMAIGSAVATGTAGSVLFVGAGGLLAQDNTNLFWADTMNRLGIGTNAPNAPLHVLNDTATTLATFKGEGPFASVFFQLGDGSQTAALRVYPGINASVGAPLIGNGGVIIRGHYWNGSASIPVDSWVRIDMAAVTPRYHMAFGVGALENMWIRQDGQITLGASLPFNSGPVTQPVVLAGEVFVNTDVTFNGLVNVVMPDSNGPVWGTAPTQTQAWWGATPVAQAAAPTGTDTQKIDGLITILGTYGLLG